MRPIDAPSLPSLSLLSQLDIFVPCRWTSVRDVTRSSGKSPNLPPFYPAKDSKR